MQIKGIIKIIKRQKTDLQKWGVTGSPGAGNPLRRLCACYRVFSQRSVRHCSPSLVVCHAVFFTA